MDYPKIRALEAIPVKKDLIALRDPLSISDKMLFVPPNVLFICTLFDGKNSIVDVQAKYTRMYGDIIFSDKIKEILNQLDSCFFLENERFYERKKEITEAFIKSDVRKASHAGGAYEENPETLIKQIDSFFASDGGPGNLPKVRQETSGERIRGIIAPHIDPRRGGTCYARSYGKIAQSSSSRRFVILGISHAVTEKKFVLTRKDFETPLGRVKTDRTFIDSIAKKCKNDFFTDEFVHRNEHSIEFQVLFLQYLFRNELEISIVPVLCSSINHVVGRGSSPMENEEVSEFINAVKMTEVETGDKVCFIAGVDLSHIGNRFGQSVVLSQAFLEKIERDDRKMLDYVLALDGEGFFRFIQDEEDRRNVCGVPAIYTLLKAIDGGKAELLKYDMSVESQTNSVVSYAALALYG